MKPTPIFTTALKPEEITPEIVAQFIQRHNSNELPRLEMLDRYYNGEHNITNRAKEPGQANNKLVTNHAKYIADFTSGYLIGEPVAYVAENDITALTNVLKRAKENVQNIDLARDGAIFGRCYELIYVSQDEEATVKLARLSPLNAFVVYNDTIEQTPVFGVYYTPVTDSLGIVTGYTGVYCTATYNRQITLSASRTFISAGEPEQHYFGQLPICEIFNDFERCGDFEDALSLIDAYNTLQSDRVNDKEQFVNALLVIKGQVLGDTDEEAAENFDAIKAHGVMTMDRDSEVAYLTRQLDENSVEILKTSIVHDIHKISCVPDMSDQNFAGNVSGVAMKYKLFGLEMKIKVKERFFEEGLRYRLECIANFLRFKGTAAVDVDDIDIQFTRSLPANILETAQEINNLQGIVSQKTLLSRLPFVPDPAKELEQVKKEKAAGVERQAQTQLAMMRGEIR